MKKTAFTFLAVLATVFSLVSCTKDDVVHTTYFWTSTNTGTDPLTLFVDGQAIGELPYSNTEITCANLHPEQRQPVSMQLKSGKYRIEAKTSQGITKSSSWLKITDSGLGGSGDYGDVGGLGASSGTGNCVSVNVFY